MKTLLLAIVMFSAATAFAHDAPSVYCTMATGLMGIVDQGQCVKPASVLLSVRAARDFDATYAVISNGDLFKPADAKLDISAARCAIWGGKSGNWRQNVSIQAGEDLIISEDAKYPVEVSPTLVLKITDLNGEQIAGLTCSAEHGKNFSTDSNSIRDFLNSQFGSIATIR